MFIGLTLFPLIWVFTTSLKPNDETMSFPPKLIPEHVTFENYVFVFTNSTIVKSLYNSLIVSFGSMILNVTICALAGYTSRFEFKAKSILFSLILGLFMIPVVINIIPLYSILANLGLLNSLVSLILTFQILIIPLNVILLKNYFETIPKELEESALIDGCSKIRGIEKNYHSTIYARLCSSIDIFFYFFLERICSSNVLANSPNSTLFQVALYQFISLYRIWSYALQGSLQCCCL